MLVLAGSLAFAGQGSETSSPTAGATKLDSNWSVGDWIWDHTAFDKQTCRLWRAFEIPRGATVARARLRITADNGFRVLLNGREVGRGSDWRSLTEYDLTWLLRPGRHVLAVEAFNDRLEGGLLGGLRIELMDGEILEIPTDSHWHIVPERERRWEHKRQSPAHWSSAVVVGRFGAAPWTTLPLAVTQVPPLLPPSLRFWQTGWFQVLLLGLCGVAVLACLRLMARLAVQSKAQEMLQRERARIARDIHDELGAGLTQLLLLGEVAQKESSASAPIRGQVERVCDKARRLSIALDEVLWAVNSRRDTLRDFASHACKYAQSFLASTPIRCRLDVESELPPLPFDLPVRRNLFLAVKEALNNAAKYSGAAELFLRIHRHGPDAVVIVEDDGRGFDRSRLSDERNGLSNMEQRMAEVGGTCEVASLPGVGCRVTFRVPVQRAARRGLRWLRFARSEQPMASPRRE
jgi:signal transduction histidine kinase